MHRNFPEVKKKRWDGKFWSPSYCLITTSQMTLDLLKKYVENQGKIHAKTYKFRLYPTKNPEQVLMQTLEHCRTIYNTLREWLNKQETAQSL
jgi:hypothetical protein